MRILWLMIFSLFVFEVTVDARPVRDALALELYSQFIKIRTHPEIIAQLSRMDHESVFNASSHLVPIKMYDRMGAKHSASEDILWLVSDETTTQMGRRISVTTLTFRKNGNSQWYVTHYSWIGGGIKCVEVMQKIKDILPLCNTKVPY